MSDDTSAFLVEDFIHSVAAQLDRVQDALRLKAVNRPLTYALKDFSLDLHVFAEMDADGQVRFRTAGPNEAGASTVRLAFTTITRPMIEENTVSLQAAAGPSLDELGLDPAERRRLEQLGVRNAGQLTRLQRSAGAGTIQRLAQVPADRLRQALSRGRPSLDRISIVPGGGTAPSPLPAPPAAGPQPPAPRPPTPPPAPPVRPGPRPPGPGTVVGPPVPAGPGGMVRPGLAPRLRLEGRNLLGEGLPRARFNDRPVPIASADEEAIELELPETAGVLTLELADGETHQNPGGAPAPGPDRRALGDAMRLSGFLQLCLRPGEAPAHVPAHVDVLLGAGRPVSRLDGGPIDRAVARHGGAFRAANVFPARRSFLRVGAQHLGYDDVEHALGLSRTLRIEVAEWQRTEDVIADLRGLAAVEAVLPETVALAQELAAQPVEEAPPATGSDRARELVRAAEALALEPGDERVTTAVVDTGVALGHAELRRKLLAGYDTVDIDLDALEGMALVGDSRGRDFNPRDDVGHGTHVAGIIGAQGFRAPRGLGGRALVLPLRVLAAAVAQVSGRRMGVGGLSDIDCGLKVACDLGAKVINLSLGTAESALTPGQPPPHAAVVRYAARAGCVLVAAAGNSGRREAFYPAALPEVIAVGSVSDERAPSAFSTRGPHVALAAPGERVLSLGLSGLRRSTGTSHAAPFVAGAAALLVSRARRRGRDLDGAAVRRLLTGTARRLEGEREAVGAGLLDAAAALRALDREQERGS
ncbi:MAG: S8 family serine peptidase [Anaeromyxobacter sp.]